ncbi:type IX secretion system outer membrane channel protein PorV [bacterium]|nr:type IX secretion system outer membrane channel protein PorV [bacterium]
MKKLLYILTGFLIAPVIAIAQVNPGVDNNSLLGQKNVITTSVPFLLITPDSRAAGMGDLGAATPGDANSIHWNPAKMAFIENKAGISLSGAPWLRTLVPDVWFYYLSGYTKIGDQDRSAVAASLRYFTLGDIQFTDENGNPLGNYEPKEFAFDGSYSTQLSDHFSMGIALRFIFSDLARGQTGVSGAEIKAGLAGAGDISAYYKNDVKLGSKDFEYGIGATISNIGNKITYTNDAERDFIPINLRVGTFWKTQLDEYNEIGFGVDFNKLLVPTPQYEFDTMGNIIGRIPSNAPVIQGMLQSFGDAPGGFREELNEITVSIGAEYWYAGQFALRAGYFYENANKGAREYVTFGAGLKYSVFQIDAAYLQPFSRRHPLQNTIRFSLLFDIQAFSEQ